MKLVPEYRSRLFENGAETIKTLLDLFPEEKDAEITFENIGYLLYRKSDGANWGVYGQKIRYLFMTREDAEEVRKTIDLDNSWEVRFYGLTRLKEK